MLANASVVYESCQGLHIEYTRYTSVAIYIAQLVSANACGDGLRFLFTRYKPANRRNDACTLIRNME